MAAAGGSMAELGCPGGSTEAGQDAMAWPSCTVLSPGLLSTRGAPGPLEETLVTRPWTAVPSLLRLLRLATSDADTTKVAEVEVAETLRLPLMKSTLNSER